MWKPSKPVVVGAGALITGHFLLGAYGKAQPDDDQLQLPPLAAVVASTASASLSTGYTYMPSITNAVTDDEHRVTAAEKPSTISKTT